MHVFLSSDLADFILIDFRLLDYLSSKSTSNPIQQKFFEFLSTQNRMHTFTLNPISPFHSPAGRPAVILNQLEVLPILLYRLWAGIDPPACKLPS